MGFPDSKVFGPVAIEFDVPVGHGVDVSWWGGVGCAGLAQERIHGPLYVGAMRGIILNFINPRGVQSPRVWAPQGGTCLNLEGKVMGQTQGRRTRVSSDFIGNERKGSGETVRAVRKNWPQL